MIEREMYFGTKRYRDRPTKKRAPKPEPTFTERKPGDDVVQDIIEAAALIRRAHPSYKDAGPLMSQDGGTRMFWALMLDAVCKATGLSLDDAIERIRTQATAQAEARPKQDRSPEDV